MVKIWKVNIILCNVLTLHLCTLFLVQGGKWTGYGDLKINDIQLVHLLVV